MPPLVVSAGRARNVDDQGTWAKSCSDEIGRYNSQFLRTCAIHLRLAHRCLVASHSVLSEG